MTHKVFIYAVEGMYQGLHGVYWQGVVEVDNRKEADDWGREMAYELIESYGLEEEYEDSFIDYYSECYWEVHEIKPTLLSVKELDEICGDLDRDAFIEEYCYQEEWE